MAEEFRSDLRLHRQQSLPGGDSSPHSHPHSILCCCLGANRRGRSLADCEFNELFRHCTGFFSSCASGGTQNANPITIGDDGDDQDLLPYKMPSRFKLFCRKVKAEARNMRRPSGLTASGTSRFHYDALSYAMNFDDGTWAQTQDYEGNNVQMRLHSARFSGSIPMPILPPAIPSES